MIFNPIKIFVLERLFSKGQYYAKPGEIEFTAKTESASSVTLDVKADQTHYIKGTVGIGLFVARPHLVVVPPEVGEKEIAGCKLIPEKKEKTEK